MVAWGQVDGQRLRFASGDRVNALDPQSGDIVGALDIAAHAGTAFDGTHLFQIAEGVIRKIDPKTGKVLHTIPAPGESGGAGLAWAGSTSARTAAARSIRSDRFVTGVTWVDGELWHGTWQGETSDVRRIDPRTEFDGGDRFFW